MKTTEIGHKAEAAAVSYLKQNGFKVLDQNWRTRYCEIDVVAEKGNCVYFVEVKYRKSNEWGGGLEYITHTKQKQMTLAAEMWVFTYDWQKDYALAAIELSGEAFTITNIIFDL